MKNVSATHDTRPETSNLARVIPLPVRSASPLKEGDYFDQFRSLLGVGGKTFGQPGSPVYGISDGHEGVQWNLAVDSATGEKRLGVNLEGVMYSDWPVRKFIFSELCHAKIENVSSLLANPDEVRVRFRRDAWQVTARPEIEEQILGGREFTFAEMTLDRWEDILVEALDCLDKGSNYRGRATQKVTLAKQPGSGERVREMKVSPHLYVWMPLPSDRSTYENLAQGFYELEPVYHWIGKAVSRAGAVA